MNGTECAGQTATTALRLAENALASAASGGAPKSPDDVVALLRTLVNATHELQRATARWLRAAEAMAGADPAGWTTFGVTGFGQLCEERLGLWAASGWLLRRAAEGCDRSAALAEGVAQRALSLPKAAAIASVLDLVADPASERRLLDFAASATTQETRREADRMRTEAGQDERLTTIALHLTRAGLGDLRRARELLTPASGGETPSASEAVEVALSEFVDRRCPEQRALRAARRGRRRGPSPLPRGSSTGASHAGPRDRHVPADVRHEVVKRHGDVCAVAGCDERGALQFAHIEPFAAGGPQTAENLELLCLRHHRSLDSGQVQRDADGCTLVARDGRVVGRLRECAPP